MALLGCTRKSAPVTVAPEADGRCLIPAGPGEPRDTLTVVLTDPVNLAHAPIPTNDSEQLLFRARSETLVQVDCEGRAHPGAALAWRADSGRRAWVFTVRGSPYSSGDDSSAAATFVSSWRARPAALNALGIEAASVEKGGGLSVIMREPLDSVPVIFADLALAIFRETSANPAVKYRLRPDDDPRDVLDQGADLMVTRDPALVDYAAGKPELTTHPLPWSRTYLLLQPPGAGPIAQPVGRDAVRADAREAEPPFWWENRRACGEPPVPLSGPSSNRVAYPRGDPTAQALAERIVALASPGSDFRTFALERAAFTESVANGAERAYIIAVPRHSYAPCRDSAGWPSGSAVHALIDTRAHAIVRRGTPSLHVDWDGTIRTAPPTGVPEEAR